MKEEEVSQLREQLSVTEEYVSAAVSEAETAKAAAKIPPAGARRLAFRVFENFVMFQKRMTYKVNLDRWTRLLGLGLGLGLGLVLVLGLGHTK